MFSKKLAAVLSCLTITMVAEQPAQLVERPIVYAPWREAMYTAALKDQFKEVCPFCTQCAANNDDYYCILARGHHTFILMNAYPYSKGHLLIIPYAHVAQLKDLSEDARHEMMEFTIKAIDILKETLNPEGFNVGFNFGRIAGASVPQHLHMQIIPRYPRNVAFLDVIGNTSLITFDIKAVYKQLLLSFHVILNE